jgi:threonine dehydrogenase-like Zn-dependent dehydrogenase
VAAHGVALIINPASVNPNIPIEWCAMSDERPEVTTRRDDSRPVNSFQGLTVHIWGCGGLGSWIAEFIARAGAAHITVCDPGTITGGLLVRQDYIEADVGDFKATALARRLRAISDHLVVETVDGPLPSDPVAAMAAADLVIDATVSVAIGQCLDVLAATPGRKALLAQVATDARSGTLGVLNVSARRSHRHR